MKPIGASDVGGRRRTGGVSRMIVTTMFVLVTMATPTMSQTCTMINQWQYDCVSSGQTWINVSCPAIYQVVFRQSSVYQLNAACPSKVDSSIVPSSPPIPQSAFFPTCSLNVSSCLYNVTTPSSGGSAGSYVVATQYRCMPVFNTAPTPTTGITISQTSNVTTLNSGVVFASGSALTTDTTRYFTAYVPANVEAIVSMRYFTKVGVDSSGCSCRLEVQDANNQTVAQFCNASSPEVSLGCISSGRIFYVRYVSSSPSVKVLYGIQFTVPSTAKLTGQGGDAPVPLEAPAPVTSDPPTTQAPVTSATAGQSPVNNVQSLTTAVASAVSTGAAPTLNETSASPTAGGGGSSATVGIAVGASVAGGVVGLAVIIGIILRLRSAAVPALSSSIPQAVEASPQFASVPPPNLANYQLDPHSANTAPFRNITEFYIDGNSTSKLVLNRKNEPPVFKTVVKV